MHINLSGLGSAMLLVVVLAIAMGLVDSADDKCVDKFNTSGVPVVICD